MVHSARFAATSSCATKSFRARTARGRAVKVRASGQQITLTIIDQALIDVLALLGNVDEAVARMANAVAVVLVRERIGPAQNALASSPAEETSGTWLAS